MMPVPWLFRMEESSASLPSPVASLVRIGGRQAGGQGMVLAVGAICPKPLSPEPVVRAGEEGARDIPPPGMGPAGAREP